MTNLTERRLMDRTALLMRSQRTAERDYGFATAAGGPVIGNVIDAHAALAALTESIARAIVEAPAPDPAGLDSLSAALDLEDELFTFLADRRVRRREALDRGLRRLRSETSTGALVASVCEEAVRSCGMQRCLLSRVRDGVWSPWASYDGDGANAGPWLPDPPERFALAIEDMELERTIIESSRPAIVVSSGRDARVHPSLRRLLGVHSYVVVPIAPNTTVVGLLHLDRGLDPRVADSDDEALGWAFAEGFGRIYERALVRERCEAQRAFLHAVVVSVEERAASISTTVGLDLEHQPDGLHRSDAEASIATPTPGQADVFTGRERDVLLLMLDGLSNARIAELLVVSPATVKSHVRQILRKVGAVNRIDAIARLLPVNLSRPDRAGRDG